MNSCFVLKDCTDLSAFPDFFNMRKFTFRDNGLVHTTDLHFKMPVLEILDLQDNRVYEVEAIDDLANFTSLVEVNFANNPVNIHAGLQEMICEANPLVEIVNRRQIHEIGYREEEGIRKLRQDILAYD